MPTHHSDLGLDLLYRLANTEGLRLASFGVFAATISNPLLGFGLSLSSALQVLVKKGFQCH
jgi:hypothetical protein